MTCIVIESLPTKGSEEAEDRFWGPFRDMEQASHWIEAVQPSEGKMRIVSLVFALTKEHLTIRDINQGKRPQRRKKK